jgi:hypothetical protein
MFAGTDSVWSLGLWLIQIGDTLVAVDSPTFLPCLQSAGFAQVQIQGGKVPVQRPTYLGLLRNS